MDLKRVIARLDIKGDKLIKGMHLEGWRFLGNPKDFCKKYYQDNIDEIIYIDAVASLYGRDALIDLVKQTTKDVFVPITAGGGVRTIDDAYQLLRSGADKIAINSEAIKNPRIIEDLSNRFGSQCVVLSVQAKKTQNGNWQAYYDVGRENSEKFVEDWIIEAVNLGAGEILLTSIDKEGTRKGFDLELIKTISKQINVPLIVSGGFGTPNDYVSAINNGADAATIAYALHYNQYTVQQIKEVAKENKILVR